MLALEPSARRAIVATSRQLVAKQLITATRGSISARIDHDLAICTPEGVAGGELTLASLVKVRIPAATVIGGGKPALALPAHIAIYTAVQAGAILHAQPPSAMRLLSAEAAGLADGAAKQAVLGGRPVLVVGGGCASRVADAVKRQLGRCEAVFAPELGLFVWSSDLSQALAKLEELERLAEASKEGQPARSTTTALTERNAQSARYALPANADITALAAQISRSVVANMAGTALGAVRASAGTSASAATSPVVCNACGRCTNCGGSLPSATQQAALFALRELSQAELVTLIAESTREVLAEKGLLK